MQKTGITLAATIMGVIVLHSFKSNQTGTIGGTIVPQDGATVIWAIQQNDTVKTSPANGAFSLEAKSGVWKVIIDAKEPYRDVMIENIQVNDGKETNVGEIRLQK